MRNSIKKRTRAAMKTPTICPSVRDSGSASVVICADDANVAWNPAASRALLLAYKQDISICCKLHTANICLVHGRLNQCIARTLLIHYSWYNL